MAERTLVPYRNGDLVDMCNLGTVWYRFVVRFNLGMRMLQMPRCLL
jgi:hypothetical protein